MPASLRYCKWKGLTPDAGIFPLPFNLILKSTHKTRREEALAMSVACRMGIPSPKVLGYGAPGFDSPFSSILMTRIPGITLALLIDCMRACDSPWGSRICSVDGGPVTGPRLPGGQVGPCDDENAFHDAFLALGSPNYWYSSRPFSEVLATAQEMATITHTITFTHGDLMGHNIMVHDGHISGIIDWECAGWFPEYWEYVSMLRFPRLDTWWFKLVLSLPGYKYSRELECFRAMWLLAEDSFSW
ncbi:kinase-like protein [Panus rudis PR-1116 ss-1]|nr:kinase-like protein [Panus rudis PR-1116 ss-1]